MLSLTIAIVFIALFLLIVSSIVWWSVKNGISPMPTSRKSKRIMLRLIPKLDQGKIVDLGSGWGTLAIPIAKANKNRKVVGYETSPIPFFVSRIRAKLVGSHNIQFFRKNFFEISLADSAVVVCYLYPAAMSKLKAKFEKELKPGTLVISNTFAIPAWNPEQVFNTGDLYNSKIYFYRR